MRIQTINSAIELPEDTQRRLDPTVARAREIVADQAAAVAALAERIDRSFSRAVDLMVSCRGHVIISGIGKSGHIGKKLAATLASTGTPSFFLHAAEAYHGDLGMITEDDVVVLISYSGGTEEVVRLLPHLDARRIPTISLVGKPESKLGQGTRVTLDVSVDHEAGPNGLAPTNSTLATLAMGDALAVALMEKRRFQAEEFARFHPGGSLGRRLLTKVEHAMAADAPNIDAEATAAEAGITLARARAAAALVTSKGKVAGVLHADAIDPSKPNQRVSDIADLTPVGVAPSAPMCDVVEELNDTGKRAAIVLTDDGVVAGVVEVNAAG